MEQATRNAVSDAGPSAHEIAHLLKLFAQTRYAEALPLARTLTARFPDSGFGWKVLGAVFKQMGRNEDALGPMQRAADLSPGDAEGHSNLAYTLRDLGRLEDALTSCRRALQLKPDFAEAHNNLATTLQDLGRHDDAEASCRQALELRPDFAEAHNNLGNTLKELGRFDEAKRCYRRALDLQPAFAEAHTGLGNVLKKQGRLIEAVACHRLALKLRPEYAEAHNNLGSTLHELGRMDQAVLSYQQALSINPRLAGVYCNTAIALKDLGRLVEAEAVCRSALALQPDFVEGHNILGTVLQEQGRLEEATANYRRALKLNPDFAEAHSNLLFCLSHDETMTPAALFAEHRAFGARFEPPSSEPQLIHHNSRDPLRRLRVGFVSGDLRDHAVAYFLEPVWAALDRSVIEIWVYSNYAIEDHISLRLRALSHVWRKVSGWRDADLVTQIRADEIDVLFDLSGHTAYNRLLTFSQKPAPIQVNWVGYPNTTGLRALDYVVCDSYDAPHGFYEHFYVEKFVRLPSARTFAPSSDAPSVNALPALSNGYITFGSFNRTSKLGDHVIAAWSQILSLVPDSQLLLGAVTDAGLAQNLTAAFGRYGISAERLSFHPILPLQDYLALHSQIDIILDTWPYSGGTTTNHALWMGVPVVTLIGPGRAHCQSAAALGRIGLDDWVATDVDTFVRIATKQALDPEKLARLRKTMRKRWQAAPLLQPATVARGLEKAVRVMWERWCAGLPVDHFDVS